MTDKAICLRWNFELQSISSSTQSEGKDELFQNKRKVKEVGKKYSIEKYKNF